MANTGVITDNNAEVTTRVTMRPPRKYNVILFNDDVTTIDFVVRVLMHIFQKSLDEAAELTSLIHEQGRGIAGTYSHELASQKRDDTLSIARAYEFPLKCEIQEA